MSWNPFAVFTLIARGGSQLTNEWAYHAVCCIYPHREGSSQQNLGFVLDGAAVFTLIARGVHSSSTESPMNSRCNYPHYEGCSQLGARTEKTYTAVITLITRGVHSVIDGKPNELAL